MYKQTKYYMGEPSAGELERLEEIKFYLSVIKLTAILHNPMQVTQLINLICPENIEHILEPIIQKIIVRDTTFVPTDSELVVLLHKCNVSSRSIKSITTYAQDKIYNILTTAAIDPGWYHKRTDDETLNVIKAYNTHAKTWSNALNIGGKI